MSPRVFQIPIVFDVFELTFMHFRLRMIGWYHGWRKVEKTQDIHSTFEWWWCDDVMMTPTETTYITTKVKQNKKTPGCVRLYAKKENEVRSIHGIYQLFTHLKFWIAIVCNLKLWFQLFHVMCIQTCYHDVTRIKSLSMET